MSPVAAAAGAWRNTLVAGILAMVAGYVDTVGFLALLGLFTAHVTGNFVLLGATLVDPHHGLVAKLLALPVFVASIALGRWLQSALSARGRDATRSLLSAQAILLTAFLAAGLAAQPVTDPDDALAVLAGMFGVAAMGLQNLAAKTSFSALSPTTVMTGNVTQFTMDCVDMWATTDDAQRGAIRARIGKMWPPVVSFAAGAIAGGLATLHVGFWSLAVPIVALVLLAVTHRVPSPAR